MMTERENKIQAEIIESSISSLWEMLGRYARGTPRLIMFLHKQDGPMNVGDLAEAFNVSMPRVSSMIRRLEFERIVRRVKHKVDYRTTYIELTDKGREHAESLIQMQTSIVHQLIERVGSERIERFLEDAKVIDSAARDIIKEDSTCCD